MTQTFQRDLARDLLLPTLLFAVLGAMTWAVRGSSGFGGEDGCIFAGVAWGTAWWFMAHEPAGHQSRRYSSGWIILAMTIGVGISGARGWMQWSSFFDGHLQTNTAEGRFVPIPRAYGFVWLFAAGVPWAGLGACMVAWCGSAYPTRARHWIGRLACGVGMAVLARIAFENVPQFFLPLYETMKSQYADLTANPNLRRLINDNRNAITHLGLYSGFLMYEMGRKDWKNVLLISTVGLVNGIGWALLQNWKWAPKIWPDASFNWWRCWESSGGISIGLAYGVAFYLVNGRNTNSGVLSQCRGGRVSAANLERFGAYFGLLLGLGLSLRNGLKGWANIYLGNEDYWSGVLWTVFGPLLILGLALLLLWLLRHPVPAGFQGDLFPRVTRMMWIVLIVLNVVAQLVTGPPSHWSEMVFSIYYALLFVITALVVYHVQTVAKAGLRPSNVR